MASPIAPGGQSIWSGCTSSRRIRNLVAATVPQGIEAWFFPINISTSQELIVILKKPNETIRPAVLLAFDDLVGRETPYVLHSAAMRHANCRFFISL